MADATKDDVAGKLEAPGFARSQPEVSCLSDPIADTPMVVTLEELHAYESQPRVTRNPKYDDIKASIRVRGLDAPPPITRRPGESAYIVRNGGNTRLSILRELWAETKDDQFFRIRCLFRPWSPRGEIVVLTGHLSENELRGDLTFIERALGVEKARELYEAECGGRALSQSELSRRLTADGFPITQSQISRMQDAIRHVLPAIPTALYGGLGRNQVERLTALRRAAARVHSQHVAADRTQSQFSDVFQEVLAQFDSSPEGFNVQRVRDELIGQLSSLLSIDYDSLAIEIVDAETRHVATSREPMFHVKQNPLGAPAASTPDSSATTEVAHSPSPADPTPRANAAATSERIKRAAPPSGDRLETNTDGALPTPHENDQPDTQKSERIRGNIVSPTQTTDRVQAIRRLVADATGAPLEDFQSNVLRAIPVAAGGLHPVSDVWFIEPAIDTVDRLRIHAAQLAIEIAHEASAANQVEALDDGIGFSCSLLPPRPADTLFMRSTLILLGAISARFVRRPDKPAIDDVRLSEYLGALLIGTPPSSNNRLAGLRLSDTGLVKLFRLIRLGRRILELQTKAEVLSDEQSGR